MKKFYDLVGFGSGPVDDGQEGRGLEEWDYCDECKKLVIGIAIGAGEEYLHTECDDKGCGCLIAIIAIIFLVNLIWGQPGCNGKDNYKTAILVKP